MWENPNYGFSHFSMEELLWRKDSSREPLLEKIIL
ncbi:hypothetical protein ABID13_000812 [Enterocloster citroniae]|uniref:Uncharacterized protein n=1 Tax=Enterocloster citroniae TaxID=358743 RepID=A0ABV2FT52_9FIRM